MAENERTISILDVNSGKVSKQPLSTNDETAEMQSGLQQVDPEQWDIEPKLVLWGVQGNRRNTLGGTIESIRSELQVGKPTRTRFVAVRNEEDIKLEVFDQEKHGEWGRIQQKEMTPAELEAMLFDQADDYEGGLHANQVKNTRKKKASQTSWDASAPAKYSIKNKED